MSVEISNDEYKTLVITRFESVQAACRDVQAVKGERVRLRKPNLPNDEGEEFERAELLYAIADITLTLWKDMKEIGLEEKAKEITSLYSKPREQQPAA